MDVNEFIKTMEKEADGEDLVMTRIAELRERGIEAQPVMKLGSDGIYHIGIRYPDGSVRLAHELERFNEQAERPSALLFVLQRIAWIGIPCFVLGSLLGRHCL